MTRRPWLGSLILGTLGLGVALGYRFWDDLLDLLDRPPAQSQTQFFGRLPIFTLQDTEGRTRSSSEWQGKLLVLNFWATWCPPCREEIPEFMRWQEQWGSRGLQFVGIAVDAPDAVQRYLEANPVNYPILIGGMSAIDIGRSLGNRLQGLPFSAIFDPQGHLLMQRGGILTSADLHTLLPHLPEPR